MAEADYVISTFDDIMAFLIRKGFVSSGNGAPELDK
jgi:DNA polymerase III alpha subunit (gram-positive type)